MSTENIRPGARVGTLRSAPNPWGGHAGTVVWTSGQGHPLVYAVQFDHSNLRLAVFAANEVEIIDA